MPPGSPEVMRIRRLLVIGLDGLEPSLVHDLVARGRLPHLARLMRSGCAGRVRSTTPDTSLAAWTSALTGLSPGRHGLVNFLRREPGAYRLRLVDATDRRGPTLLAQAARAGLKVAALGVPGTWPPEPELAFGIAGFDSPLATRAAPAAHTPPGLCAELAGAGLAWPYGGLDEMAVGAGWHRRAAEVLVANVGTKLEVIEHLAGRGPVDLLWVVLSESDTAAHHLWAFADPDSPRHARVPALTGALQRVYRALDEAVGTLMRGLDADGSVLVLSDHGACGAADRVVYLNRWLADHGYLRFAAGGRAAAALRDSAARWLPMRIKQALLRSRLAGAALRVDGRARFGGLDLAASRAFSDELPQTPGVWIHAAGRDPLGPVAPDAFERTRDEIARGLLAWRTAHTGQPVVARVLRREDALAGPAARRAPDLLVELARIDGYKLVADSSQGRPGPLQRRLDPAERIGAKGIGTAGVHAPDGFLAAAGPQIRPGAKLGAARLEDVAPTALRLLGLEPSEDLDGRPLAAIAPAPGAVRLEMPTDQDLVSGRGPVDDAEVLGRLERLGYL